LFICLETNSSRWATAWADGGTNDICPAGFNVPTLEAIENEIKENFNVVDMFASFLKMPASGLRDSNVNHPLNYSLHGIKD
jgi:hypothetical protein